MNLIDAIKSGRPFKRKCYDESGWCHVAVGTDDCQEVQFIQGDNKRFLPFADDLTADDWEVEPAKVTITRRQYWEAYLTGNSIAGYWEREAEVHRKHNTWSFKQAVALGLEQA